MKSSTVAAWILIIIAVVVIFIAGNCSLRCSNLQRDNFGRCGLASSTLLPQIRTYANYGVAAQPDLIYIDAIPADTATYETQPAYSAGGCNTNLARGIPLEDAYY